MKHWKGIEGATRVPAAADVSATEARAAGGAKPQTIGRPFHPIMGRGRGGHPARAVGTMWPLDTLADIKHVKG